MQGLGGQRYFKVVLELLSVGVGIDISIFISGLIIAHPIGF